jgi:hypothetical protein
MRAVTLGGLRCEASGLHPQHFFSMCSISYFGHTILVNNIAMDEDKVQAMLA